VSVKRPELARRCDLAVGFGGDVEDLISHTHVTTLEDVINLMNSHVLAAVSDIGIVFTGYTASLRFLGPGFTP